MFKPSAFLESKSLLFIIFAGHMDGFCSANWNSKSGNATGYWTLHY